jgi:hypothetical protein
MSVHRLWRVFVMTAACGLVSQDLGAQTQYSISDLGRASEPSMPPAAYRCCVEKMLMNGKGQLAIERVPGSTGSFDVLYWEPGMSTPMQVARAGDTVHLGALSSDRYLVGTSDGGFAVPFRWSKAAGYQALCCPDYWLPLGVNSSGVVVGTYAFGGFRAVVWTQSTNGIFLDDLDIAGKQAWVFEQATTISDDGKIGGVGRVTTSRGVETHYFVLTPMGSGGGQPMARSDWTVTATEFASQDPPAHAIDGDLNTRFSTGRAQHDSQGVLVSWPVDRTIRRIRFEVGPSTSDYPRTCGIWVKDTANREMFVNCTPDSNGTVDVSFAPVPVQRIEIWQWGSSLSWWSIAELNVYN